MSLEWSTHHDWTPAPVRARNRRQDRLTWLALVCALTVVSLWLVDSGHIDDDRVFRGAETEEVDGDE